MKKSKNVPSGTGTFGTKGITLIALVITIIILLILSGVALSQLTGNGLFGKVKQAKEIHSEQEAKEKLDIVLLNMQADKNTNKDYNQDGYLTSKIEENGMTVDGNIVTVNGWKFEIDRSVPEIRKSLGENEENDEDEYDSLIAWYDGIENTSEGHSYDVTVWKDLTGNNATGATINGARWTPNGLLFDGNDWVNMNSILMPEEDNFTIDIVLSLSQYINNSYILGQNNSSSNAGGRTGIRYYSNQVDTFSPVDTLYSNYNPRLTEKINLVIKRNENNMELWVNGQKKDEKDVGGLKISQVNTVLGRWGMYSGLYFNGVVYSVKAYNGALGEQEIKKNYTKNNKRFNIEEKVVSGEYVKEGLTAWYDGIENTGEGHSYDVTVWKDLTGNNTTGATINGATWTPNGLLFDGNDWVDMNSILMPETDNFTLSIVLSLNTYINNTFILGQNNSSSNAGGRTGIRYYSNQVDIFSSVDTLYSNYNPKPTEKVELVIIRNGNKMELWLNGEKKDEKDISGLKIAQINTIIGRWGMYSGYYFGGGVIYSIKQYNRPLSSEEIQQNYNVNKLRLKMSQR